MAPRAIYPGLGVELNQIQERLADLLAQSAEMLDGVELLGLLEGGVLVVDDQVGVQLFLVGPD